MTKICTKCHKRPVWVTKDGEKNWCKECLSESFKGVYDRARELL